ncbi:TPA: hypothetical protein ACHJ5S_002371, partial [Enterococcus faecium]
NSLRYLEFREGAFDFQTSQQNHGASYVGIGSKFFEKSAVHQLNYERLMELAESFIDSLRVE